MSVTFVWHGRRVKRQIEDRVFRGLQATARVLHRDARRAAGIHWKTAKFDKRKRVRRFRETKSGRFAKTPGTPARPGQTPTGGEPPRRRTGAGQKGIVWGASRPKLEARVGFTRNARHMTFHELGIRYKRAGFQMRSTLVRMLRLNQRRYQTAMMRGSGGFRFSGGFKA
jgi:hypothetical protein